MILQPTFGEHTINELKLLFQHRQINLDPGFQRRSVWSDNDRRRLIQSIVSGYPLPSIFLYRRNPTGRLVYDVIDGKQRLETIFMFMKLGRFKRDWFDVKLDLGEGPDWYDWPTIKRYFQEYRAAFESYKIQTVEVTGELAAIIDLFVRINSTGKRLTSGEKRHARFYRSRFLLEAERLVARFRKYLEETRVLSPAQIDRMKATELFAELLMSINSASPINKKTALDRALGNESINGNTLDKLTREFIRTLNSVRRMFPDLRQTRLRNSAEFYTLFLLVWMMDQAGFVLTERRRNSIAFELLKRLSTGVDELRDQLRKARPARPGQRTFSDYLLTVQGDTDSSANRERRQAILKGLLWTLFDRKDSNRTFSSEQRRMIWHTEEKKKCARCGRNLTWAEFTVDHVKAWSRGGETSLKNAKPMHRSCNSSKGAR
jgi:5-methylcytosine-specific restriction endonuclease McrA